MTGAASTTIHASAVLVGARAILIRGPSGTGKSRLTLELIQAANAGMLSFARLVADDRVSVEAHHDRLVVRPAEPLRGLLEVRGLGLRRLPFEPAAIVGLVVDLAAPDAERLPLAHQLSTTIANVAVARLAVARLAVAPENDAFRLILAAIGTIDATT